MQVEAIYNLGRIEFAQPLRLKHARFRLSVIVPDDELEPEPATIQLTAQASAQAQVMLDKYAAILNAPFSTDDALPELTAEYEERLEAIDLHAQLRQEQGRPV